MCQRAINGEGPEPVECSTCKKVIETQTESEPDIVENEMEVHPDIQTIEISQPAPVPIAVQKEVPKEPEGNVESV